MSYIDEIMQAVADETVFIRLTLSGPSKPSEAPYQKVVIRPVVIGDNRVLQAQHQAGTKQLTENIAAAEAPGRINQLLGIGFRHINLERSDGALHVRITKKGRELVSRGKSSAAVERSAPLAHDREKAYPFPDNEPNAFLEALGVMRGGHVIPSMREKFRQINHFLTLLSHTRLVRNPPSGPLRLVDCGCGRAFLTLAACRYLRDKEGVDARLAGVDVNVEVIEKASLLRDRLGMRDVELKRTAIDQYQPEEHIHAVISLHACDTATDEAIAQGIRWQSELILCAPCCQHELHHAIVRPEFRAVLRHGILRERLADALTDGLRAAALRVMGYSTDVVEFIGVEETPRNLMIRAERERVKPLPGAVQEYLLLRDFWSVRPAIERLLGEDFASRLAQSTS